MSAAHRLILLVIALSGAGIYALLGTSYARAAAAGLAADSMMWATAGALVFGPLWAPALVPARYPRLLRACRRIGAIGAGLPLYMFGSSVVHQVERLALGAGGAALGLVVAATVSAGCVIGMAILLRAGTGSGRALPDGLARTAGRAHPTGASPARAPLRSR